MVRDPDPYRLVLGLLGRDILLGLAQRIPGECFGQVARVQVQQGVLVDMP